MLIHNDVGVGGDEWMARVVYLPVLPTTTRVSFVLPFSHVCGVSLISLISLCLSLSRAQSC